MQQCRSLDNKKSLNSANRMVCAVFLFVDLIPTANMILILYTNLVKTVRRKEYAIYKLPGKWETDRGTDR